MKRICRSICVYVLLAALVALGGLALEYLTGLLPQERVTAHYVESCEQFLDEGYEPFILNRYRADSRLNNYSELLILHYATFMDTAKDPSVILTNAARVPETSSLPRIEELREAAQSGDEPNSFYTRYWMGFRIPARALLSVMSYADMRRVLLWTFGLLLTLAILLLQRATRSVAPPLVFAGSLLLVNPIVVSTSFQYGCCFLLALLGTIAMCLCRKDSQRLRLLFVLGLLTQFFDFYTAPVVTLCYPLLTDCAIRAYRAEDRRCGKLIAGSCALWLVAYGGMWLLKLALTELFTEQNAFAIAFQSFSGRTGLVHDARYDYSPLSAFKACLTVLGGSTIAVVAAVSLALLIRALLARPSKAAWASALPAFGLTLLPLLWVAVAAQPTILHGYFQYRTLAPLLYGAMLCPLLLSASMRHVIQTRGDIIQ